MKKSLLIAALMLLVAGSASAYDFMYNGLAYKITGTNPNTVKVTCQYTYANTSTKARYDKEAVAGKLIIPSYANYNGKSYAVTAIDDYAFYRTYGETTEVQIAPSVETIGSYAFSYFSSTEYNVVFTDVENSKLKNIKKQAFYVTTHLKSIAIPATVTSIGDSAFCRCSSINSLKFSEPSQLTTIGNRAFCYGGTIQSLELPGSLTTIGVGAFQNCYITNLVLKEGITTVSERMFCDDRITSVSLPSTLTTIGGYAFASCHFESIEIPNSVTSIGDYAFRLNSFTTVTIPSGVTTMGVNVFSECANLKSAVVNNSVLGSRQFGQCTSLDNVTLSSSITAIPNYCFYSTALKKFTIPSNITSVGYMAFSNTKIETLTIDADLETVGDNVFQGTPVKTLNVNSNTFKSSMFPDLRSTVTTATFGDNVTTIAEGALQDFAVVEQVTIPAGIKSIGNSAFSGCTQMGDFIAKMAKPIAIDASVFNGVSQHGYCDLHVPEGSAGRYGNMEVWKEFYMIIEDAGHPSPSGIKGDVNGDGEVTAADISAVVNIIAGLDN